MHSLLYLAFDLGTISGNLGSYVLGGVRDIKHVFGSWSVLLLLRRRYRRRMPERAEHFCCGEGAAVQALGATENASMLSVPCLSFDLVMGLRNFTGSTVNLG